ncbi:hypothetical protein COHA_006179 [Chlorella ohadii]|uniref:BTB domain-containing protein n=1 Tax=Chlorella ohadii TaxID=2649997 RepID=A0AAD5H4Q4_9CHLO|nr:hypothetical protein COHA_006179 [Chlorella ohadii]
MAASDELIVLNVGGRLFHTTRATLTKHPDSMLAAMFRGDMQATALRDEQGHPFLDRDPAHFPFVLAYLRDGHIPPLPQGLLELRQLQVEAEFFAMAELAAAAAEAAATIEARRQAQQELEQGRAAALRAAEAAVAQAQQELDAIAEVLAPLRAAQQEAEALQEEMRRRAIADGEDNAPEEDPAEARRFIQQLEDAELHAARLKQQMRPQLAKEESITAQLHAALLARLCALGADLPAAEAQLRATHPQLAQAAARQPMF